MKRFIIISLLLLVFAVVATVVVWSLLQDEFERSEVHEEHGSSEVQAEGLSDVETEPVVTQSESEVEIEQNETVSESGASLQQPEETPHQATDEIQPIPLRDLPLSDTQRSMIEVAGIDVETFVITADMIACAEEKLGSERFQAVIGGEAPSFLEGTRLLGCIR